ncbi:hypothetical protein C0991_011952 [Blastosporella zonata]|nr:hypothetical protein C0991_011952 [Blastosporella zonata]
METVDREDLVADPVVRYQHAYYVPIALFCGFVLPAAAGMVWGDPVGSFVWGGLISKLATCQIWPFSGFLELKADIAQQHTFPHDFRSGPSTIDWDPSKWIIIILHSIGLASHLRRAKEHDIVEAISHMHRKTQVGGHSQEKVSGDWTGEVWTHTLLLEYIQALPGRCIIEIDGFAVDATKYLAEHVRP